MRSFFREYAMTIVSAVVLTVLLLLCTPIGESTKIAILRVIGVYEEQVETVKISFSAGGGEFDTDAYQVEHMGEKGVYISRTLITIDVPKNEAIKESAIPELDASTPRDGFTPVKGTAKKSFKLDNSEEYLIPNSTMASEGASYTLVWKTTNTSTTRPTGSRVENGQLYLNNTVIGDFGVGTVFNWNGYDWRVLKLDGQEALVITEKVLDKNFKADTYEKGTVFKATGEKNNYNGSVVEKAVKDFADTLDQTAIIKNRNITIGTKESEYVFEEKQASVFLLSYQEIKQYFTTEKQRVAYNGVSAMSYWTRSGERIKLGQDKDPNTGEYVSFTYDNSQAVFVSFDGVLNATDANTELGIRPALWLDITKLKTGDVKIGE